MSEPTTFFEKSSRTIHSPRRRVKVIRKRSACKKAQGNGGVGEKPLRVSPSRGAAAAVVGRV